MHKTREPRVPAHSNKSGSVLVFVLLLGIPLLVGIVGLLAAVRTRVHSSDDKIAFEQAYSTAFSGISATKSWMLDNSLATQQASSIASTIQKVTSGSIDLSEFITQNRSDPNKWAFSPSAIATKFYPTLTKRNLPDGRVALYEFNGPGHLVVIENDTSGLSNAPMFLQAGRRPYAYVDMMKITTPYPTDSLLRCTCIVETRGVVLGQGRAKTRTLQQRLLIFPTGGTTGPGIAIPAAYMSGSTASGGGATLSVHWAPVMSIGDMNVRGLAALAIDALNKKLTLTISNQTEFFGAGFDTGGDQPDVGLDKWVRWEAAGRLLDKDGAALFGTAIGGVTITDFFNQLAGGLFSGYTGSSLSLVNYNVTFANGRNIYYDTPGSDGKYPIGNGALTQHSSTVTGIINGMFNSLNYSIWKQYAISKNWYLRPALIGTGWVNSTGQPLYVTSQGELTTANTGKAYAGLNDITMKSYVPANGNTAALPDRILFIDTKEGTENGTPTSIDLSSNANAFFWKGMLYINGNLKTSGPGSMPTVLMQNPDQYAADPKNLSNTGYLYKGVFLDGLVYVTGNVTQGGSAAIYGSMVAKNGQASSGVPRIYYNSRLAAGLFAGTGSVVGLASIVSGPIQELGTWL